MAIDFCSLVDLHGYPLYVYDKGLIERQIARLNGSFDRFRLLYSMKCNPNRDILSLMCAHGLGIDAASSNEVLLARDVGFEPSCIFYSSPGKRDVDIVRSIGHCTIVADSINELVLINDILLDRNDFACVGLRLNVVNDFVDGAAFEVMSGGAGKFGVDVDLLLSQLDFLRELSRINISGIHVYFGSQILDVTTLANNFSIIASVALRLLDSFDIRFVDFGGGFGVPFNPSDVEIDFSALMSLINSDDNINALFSRAVDCIIESGRFLVSEAGCYLSKVVDIKESFGRKFLIVYGGMNGFFRPVFTGTFHNIKLFPARTGSELVSVAGNLCTPIDVFAENILLPPASIGDVVLIENAGAYGLSMSLSDFISHDKAVELFLEGDC